MISIDKLCYQSKLRYVNAGEKFAFAMLTLLFCVISRSIAMAILVLVLTGILTTVKGGIPVLRYMRYLSIPLVFLIFSTLAIAVNLKQTPMDLFALPLGAYYLTGSKYDLLYSIQLIFTALSAVSCLYFLSLNTPVPDILEVLRKLHCPELMIELMLLIYRFIFVLIETAHAITTSQNSRLGNINYRTSLKSFGNMVSVLFVRAVKRSNALYDSMESRCYDGRIHVLSEHHPPKFRHILWITLFELFLLAFTIWKVYYI